MPPSCLRAASAIALASIFLGCSSGPGSGGWGGTDWTDHKSGSEQSGLPGSGSGGFSFGSGGSSFGPGGSSFGSGGSSASGTCDGVPCPITSGYRCIHYADTNTHLCQASCNPAKAGGDCPTGCCSVLADGTFACAPADYCCGSTGLDCGPSKVCIGFTDGTHACGGYCTLPTDCPSGCCSTLADGTKACVPPNHCNG